MPTARPRLLFVFGGRSSEHEVSLRSTASILAALDRDRFEPVLLGVRRDGSWRTGPLTSSVSLPDILSRGDEVTDLRTLAPDLVFPVLHGPFGEDGTFQGLLEVFGLPYVGSGVLASALCMDKTAIKHALCHLDPPVPVVPWVEVDARSLATPAGRAEATASVEQKLGFPCFVKPVNQGSSVGISRAADAAELDAALELALAYDTRILVEKSLDNCREIELAVLGDGGPDTLVSPPGEIVLPPGTWYDYDSKYVTDVAGLEIPATLPDELVTRLQALTLQAFRAAGCQGLARIDFFLDRATGEPYLNEVNTMPGFTSISMYPRLIQSAGVPYRDLITRLCELARAHHERRSGLRITR